jgi:threonine/homoserine/homoserine lactone efflux protein
MELSAVVGFALIAFTLIVVPGPDWAYILAAGARDHVVIPAVAGLIAGYAAITAVVAVGVGPLVARSSTALLALTVGGAAYLIYLGTKVLRSPVQVGLAGPETTSVPSRAHFLLRGAGVSALNPKGLLLFLSIQPQFTRPTSGWPIPLQLATLGAIFTLACALFYLPLGYTSDRVLGARPAAARATTKFAGVAMVVVGLALIGERLIETLA